MHDQRRTGEECLRAEALGIREPGEPAEDAVGLVGRRGRMLGEPDAVAGGEHEVGEGAADVDADAVFHPGWSVHRM